MLVLPRRERIDIKEVDIKIGKIRLVQNINVLVEERKKRETSKWTEKRGKIAKKIR